MKHKIITPKEKALVLNNFISLFTQQSIYYLLPLLVLPYLIRTIGTEKLGLIAFAQAFVQYFVIFTDYGFSLTATKKISLCGEDKKEASNIFSSVITVKMILSAISFLILLLFINFIPKFKNDWLVYIYSFGAVIGNTLFPIWFFQGKEKMNYIARINIICGLLYVTSIFIFVRGSESYIYVPLLNSLFFMIAGLCGLYIAFTKFELKFVFQKYKNIRVELKTGWNIFISIVAINAYTATRIFTVGLLTNNTLTGFYSIAEMIANFIQTFPLSSLSQAIYPRMIKIFDKNKLRAIKLMNKIQKNTTIGYAMTLPFLFIAATPIVRVICGEAFPQVILLLRLLLFPAFFVGSNAFKVQFLLVCGKTDVYARLHIIAALIGLPLIFTFTSLYSYLGPAIASIITETGIVLFTHRILRKYSISPGVYAY